MLAKDYWMLFLETGAPEVYLLYNHVRRMEEQHVFNDPGASAADRRLQ